MKFFLKKTPLLILSVTALSLFAWSVQAQNSVIPYQGTLFSQGKPVSQSTPIRMAFAIYSDSAGLEAGQDGSAPSGEVRKWTSWDATGEGGNTVDNLDETVGVQVRNGRFLVHLGEESEGHNPLEVSVFDVKPLYVVAWVVNSSGTFRLPPQKLGVVPHAVTAERATDFEVTGGLTVGLIKSQNDLLRIEGDVVINGDYHSTPERSCREGYKQVGSICFSDQTQEPVFWRIARANCAQQGGDVCSIEELMLCDALQPGGKHCGVVTDSDTLLWTRSIMKGETTPDPFVTSAFLNVACYNGTNDGNDGNDLNLCSGSTAQGLEHSYLCCHHAR